MAGIGRVVIVGSGQAGVETAAALRHHEFAGTITVVGDEPDLPYQRPPLSKEFLKSVEDASLPLRGEAFYDQNAITMLLGRRVELIDRAARTVLLDDGQRLDYDHLVLATGARNRMPPVDGIDTIDTLELRTLADARRLTGRLDQLRHVTVIGGGFIGLEVAALMRQRDIEVDVVEAADRLMGRVVSPVMSDWFLRFHESIGVRVRLVTMASAVERRADGVAVSLSDGERIETGAVLVAAGVVPNVELAAAAGLAVDNGIVVDETLLTGDPAISAIGDCALHPNRFGVGMTRLESVQNAVDQGKCVAARITGQEVAYDSLPWFWSHQGKAKLQIAGLAVGADDFVTRGNPDDGRFSVLVYRDGRLIAVESVNMPADHMASRRILAAGLSVPREAVGDPATDLKSFMPRPA